MHHPQYRSRPGDWRVRPTLSEQWSRTVTYNAPAIQVHIALLYSVCHFRRCHRPATGYRELPGPVDHRSSSAGDRHEMDRMQTVDVYRYAEHPGEILAPIRHFKSPAISPYASTSPLCQDGFITQPFGYVLDAFAASAIGSHYWPTITDFTRFGEHSLEINFNVGSQIILFTTNRSHCRTPGPRFRGMSSPPATSITKIQ